MRPDVKTRFYIATALLLAAALALCGCNRHARQVVTIRGVGASFPGPVYHKWVDEFGRLNPAVRIDYQSQGSGAGVRAIENHTADFGAADFRLSAAELQSVSREVLQVPTVLGAVVISYNLPGVAQSLKLAPDVIAGIFLGQITRWNDVHIAADNPDVALPDVAMIVVYRSDSSGTTEVFTNYLSKISTSWRSQVGTNRSPHWPDGLGIGAKGNEGVTGQVKNTPYSIGYLENVFALQNQLAIASIRNRAGKFVLPTPESLLQAAAENGQAEPGNEAGITDSANEQAYPIASYSYVLLYREQEDPAKGRALASFLWWAIHDGQKFARALQYAELPAQMVKRAEVEIDSITTAGARVGH
jgi:phosphate transport system substrate-binding protein